MTRKTFRLWKEEEYPYKSAWGFIPRLDGYFHDDEQVRPCMIIVPGGAYRRCSPVEGEPVALKFYELGYQAMVCSYTTNHLGEEPLKMQPFADLARAVKLVREHAGEYHVNPDQVVMCGFSAGAHAVGTLGVHGDPSCRPNGLILSYPVISVFTEISHEDSSLRLLGADATEEEKEFMRLETQVTADCPPVFLWQTADDQAVPVSNSIRFAEACRQAGVPFALHLFSSGFHGLSVADETVQITDENSYTLDQVRHTLAALQDGRLVMDDEFRKEYDEYREVRILKGDVQAKTVLRPNQEVQAWVGLADQWMRRLWDVVKDGE